MPVSVTRVRSALAEVEVDVTAEAEAVAVTVSYLKAASSWWMSMSVNSTLRLGIGRGGSVSDEHACTGSSETQPGVGGGGDKGSAACYLRPLSFVLAIRQYLQPRELYT